MSNILLFWFLKYIVLYIVLMFKNNNYGLLKKTVLLSMVVFMLARCVR